jgi:hypothetical protein
MSIVKVLQSEAGFTIGDQLAGYLPVMGSSYASTKHLFA